MEWLLDLLSVITINLVLSSDNALAIAMVTRNLSIKQQKQALIWGSIAALFMQICMTHMTAKVLHVPFLRIGGGVILTWIAVKRLHDSGSCDTAEWRKEVRIWKTVRSIVLANIAMSFDNVVAVAALAGDDIWLLIAGLAISCPVIISYSLVIGVILKRVPYLVWGIACYLGWIAGKIMAADEIALKLLGQYNVNSVYVPCIIMISILLYCLFKYTFSVGGCKENLPE